MSQLAVSSYRAHKCTLSKTIPCTKHVQCTEIVRDEFRAWTYFIWAFLLGFILFKL